LFIYFLDVIRSVFMLLQNNDIAPCAWDPNSQNRDIFNIFNLETKTETLTNMIETLCKSGDCLETEMLRPWPYK